MKHTVTAGFDHRHLRAAALAGTAAIALLTVGTAQGQSAALPSTEATTAEQTTPAVGAGDDTAAPDIIVTAEKHATTVMRTGIAVTALSGDDLREREVRGAADLQRFSPALSVTNNGLTNNVNIRGIGLSVTTPAVVSGVAIYRDNLFQAPLVAAEPYYDIGNIQVLRGPQGTFVGTNSTGGAIFISSANPSLADGTHGYISVQGGTYSDVGVEGAVNQPISSTLALRAAFNVESRGSFYRNLTPNPTSDFRVSRRPGNLNIAAGRIGLLWAPTSELQILTKAEYYQNRTDGFALKPIPGTSLARFAPADPFKIAYSTPDTQYNESLWRVDSEIKYQLQNGMTLRSVSGITVYNYGLTTDVGASTQRTAIQNNRAHEYLASEEINILSSETQRLRWVVGGYFSHDTANVRFGQQAYAGLGAATTPTSNVAIHLKNGKEAIAGFAGIRYNIVEGLELQAGGRYTWNKVDNDPASVLNAFLTAAPGSPANPLLVATVPQTGSERDDGATWKVALNWQANARNLIYAFVATGRKAGGIQDATVNFRPEKVTDYEAGWKSTMLDGHLKTQVGGFYNDYSDLQVVAILPASGRSSIFNSGSAKIYGFEGEAQFRYGGLQLDLAGSYLHTRVQIANIINTSTLPDGGAGTLGVQCRPGQTGACFDYGPYLTAVRGDLPYAPRYNITGGIAYTVKLGGHGATLTPRIDVARTASQFTSIFNDTLSHLRDRTIVNLKVRAELDQLSLEVFATNLNGLTYPTGRVGNAWFYGPPRQVGGRVSLHF